MADLTVKRGDSSNIESATKVDGQLLFSKEGDAIAMDYDDNGTLKRALMKVPKIQLSVSELRASSWSNNRYSFENNYPFANFDIDLSLAETATDSQIAAFSKALIIADDSENTLIARGTTPAVNIPIKMEVHSK